MPLYQMETSKRAMSLHSATGGDHGFEKKTADLIPYAYYPHLLESRTSDRFQAERRRYYGHLGIAGQTGVEMEALTAVSVAALTVYDMCKAIDRMQITEIRLTTNPVENPVLSMQPDGNAMISVSEAKNASFRRFSQMPLEQVVITDSFGRVAGEDIRSRRTQPPMPVPQWTVMLSAPRTWLARRSNCRLSVAPASGSYDKSLNAGESRPHFYRAPVPEGADAIVIQEDTKQRGETVTLLTRAPRACLYPPGPIGFFRG